MSRVASHEARAGDETRRDGKAEATVGRIRTFRRSPCRHETRLIADRVAPRRRRFTLDEARRALPLVSRIAADVSRTYLRGTRAVHARLTERPSTRETSSRARGGPRSRRQPTSALPRRTRRYRRGAEGLLDRFARLRRPARGPRGRSSAGELGERTIDRWNELDAGDAGQLAADALAGVIRVTPFGQLRCLERQATAALHAIINRVDVRPCPCTWPWASSSAVAGPHVDDADRRTSAARPRAHGSRRRVTSVARRSSSRGPVIFRPPGVCRLELLADQDHRPLRGTDDARHRFARAAGSTSPYALIGGHGRR